MFLNQDGVFGVISFYERGFRVDGKWLVDHPGSYRDDRTHNGDCLVRRRR